MKEFLFILIYSKNYEPPIFFYLHTDSIPTDIV